MQMRPRLPLCGRVSRALRGFHEARGGTQMRAENGARLLRWREGASVTLGGALKIACGLWLAL
jgi:hypothetical protein